MTNIWQLILQTNTFNFIIVLAILILIISKLNVKEKIEHIRDEIKSYVQESSNEKNLAEKELENIKKEVVKLPDEISRIKESAKNSVSSLERKIEAEVKEQMSDIDNNAKRLLSFETKKFKSKLSSILSEASIVLAKDNALKQLENNRELHNKYIEDAIEEINRINL